MPVLAQNIVLRASLSVRNDTILTTSSSINFILLKTPPPPPPPTVCVCVQWVLRAQKVRPPILKSPNYQRFRLQFRVGQNKALQTLPTANNVDLPVSFNLIFFLFFFFFFFFFFSFFLQSGEVLPAVGGLFCREPSPVKDSLFWFKQSLFTVTKIWTIKKACKFTDMLVNAHEHNLLN